MKPHIKRERVAVGIFYGQYAFAWVCRSALFAGYGPHVRLAYKEWELLSGLNQEARHAWQMTREVLTTGRCVVSAPSITRPTSE